MQAETLEFEAIRYNPESEGFEATLRVHDQNEVFAYPVQIRAPLTADYAIVARGLTLKAIALHKGHVTEPVLRTRHVAHRQRGPLAA